MPEEGICKQEHAQILRFEEMLRVVKVAVALGVEQVRITGGEPLVRKGLVDFVSQLANISGIKDLCLTTNAAKLDQMALPLKQAGLARVNVSLDSLNEATFRKITRVGELKTVFRGIHAAIEAGLNPVKINVVIIPGINDSEICDFGRFAFENPVEVRFIERMPFAAGGKDNAYIAEDEILARLKANFKLTAADDSASHGPAHNYQIVGGKGQIGFISSRTRPFCHLCRRLRLTANGILLPCLDSEFGVPIRGLAEIEIEKIIVDLYEKKNAWRKKQACFQTTFDSSLAKIGG